ncbi:hypothetical protein GGI04_005781, partial [Coemansia thaxteri]
MEQSNPLQISFEGLTYSVKVPTATSASGGSENKSSPFVRALRAPFAAKEYKDK